MLKNFLNLISVLGVSVRKNKTRNSKDSHELSIESNNAFINFLNILYVGLKGILEYSMLIELKQILYIESKNHVFMNGSIHFISFHLDFYII